MRDSTKLQGFLNRLADGLKSNLKNVERPLKHKWVAFAGEEMGLFAMKATVAVYELEAATDDMLWQRLENGRDYEKPAAEALLRARGANYAKQQRKDV